MKLLLRIVAAVLFVVFFGFALKNTQETALHFFLDYEVRAPLVLLLLSFFVGGAVLGVLAMTPTLFRHRRDVAKHKKTITALQKDADANQMARTQQPQPDSIGN
jgi:putative membrane protein